MALKKVSKPSLSGRRLSRQVRVSKASVDVKKDEKEKASPEPEPTPKKDESKMTLCTVPTIQTRAPRRPGRPPSGKSCTGPLRQREMSAKVRSSYRRSLDPCDNSNDSGIGFGDHQMDPHQHRSAAERLTWTGERAEAKRQKLDIKLEHEEVNDGYCFPENVRTNSKDPLSLIRTAAPSSVPTLSMSTNSSSTVVRTVPRCAPVPNKQHSSGPVPLTTQLLASSRYTNVSLQIVKQPEQQHRARYQTEGSRGAVKDREGNGFPIVQLVNYYKPATLQVFIGTDTGRISPHMFYQACKVSGKNSTPCTERKIDGTCVIELQLDPAKEMSATCDCVGILKERNVDVEHRFPDQLSNRSKKKSTKCRMIFRTAITLDDGTLETLQVCSQPIVCTQPPGIPEICKKSLTSCPASGGLELMVIGKNFLKDTRVIFQQCEDNQIRWEQSVVPDKEYLQQGHFVCVVPPYRRPDITEPVPVRLSVVSSGKSSESHQFVYTPVNGVPSVLVEPTPLPLHQPPTFFKSNFWQSNVSISKREQDLDMMPPPESSMVPISTRRPSINMPSTSDSHSPPLHSMKQEYIDESSQNSIIEQERYRHLSESSLDVHHGDSNMSMINENSMMSHLNENSNLSVGNEENSIDMVRGNGMNRMSNMCESSLDCGNSNMSSMNEDSTCSSALPSAPILADQNSTSMEKVMDLRMKMPMVTVADLVNTTAPSIAALQRFGIMEHPAAPLPNQSAQSVENYLNKIEAKPSMIPMTNPTGLLMKNDISQIISTEPSIFPTQKSVVMQDCGMLNVREPTFPSSARPFMSSRTQNEVMNIVAKSESAEVPEQSLPEQTNTMASSTITTVATALERSVPTPINTERLDALVNSTVESHLSPTRLDSSPKDMLINNSIPTLVTRPPPEVMIPTQDVMLNSQANLMIPPMINTTMTTSVLSQQDIATPSPNLTSEVILNSQISPSLMCRNSSTLQQETLLAPSPNINLCQPPTAVEQVLLNSPSSQLLSSTPPQLLDTSSPQLLGSTSPQLLNASSPQLLSSTSPQLLNTSSPQLLGSTSPQLLNTTPPQLLNSSSPQLMSSTPPQQNLLSTTQQQTLLSTTQPVEMVAALAAESENVVLLNAAADLLETQKKLSDLETNLPPSTSQLTTQTDTFVQSYGTMSIPVKEMVPITQSDKNKAQVDRMIPQNFTSLTENELINLINPSCFDQGNNNYR